MDQLIALSDEMAALVRAGVPLDRGLVAAGRDVKGRLGRMAEAVGVRVEGGEGLVEALEEGGASLPPFYRSTIEAGLRSGQLARAIEGLADYARGFAETRRAIGLALFYPCLVLLLAWVMFVGFVAFVAPQMADTFATMRIEQTAPVTFFLWLRAHLAYWAWFVPAVVVLGAIGWLRSARAVTLPPESSLGLLRLVPRLRSTLIMARTADFADLTALMVEHGTPLEEALDLAAVATGSDRLRTATAGLTERVRQGVPPDEAASRSGLPPMLAWVLATAGAGGALAPALRHAAVTYRARAARQAEMIRAVLPSLLVAVVGLSAGFLYALAVFRPMVSIWLGLAVPISE